MQEPKNNKQQPPQTQEKNETLKDPGARISDYGRSGDPQQQSNTEQTSKPRETRQGNSSIPMDEDDTLGIP
jgi:hypothetical protein